MRVNRYATETPSTPRLPAIFMDLEIINRLYLELSQVATVTTAKELRIHDKIGEARNAAMELSFKIRQMPASYSRGQIRKLASNLERMLNEILP